MSFFEYWFLFPITLLIATLAMAVGVEVLSCLAPFLIVGLRLPIEVAIGAALLTSACTCGSALYAYVPTKLIDYKLGLKFLCALIPSTIVGMMLGVISSELLLTTLLGGSLFAIAINFLRSPQKLDLVLMNQTIEQIYGGSRAESHLRTPEGELVSYTIANLWDGLGIAAISGLFLGMISNGLGELNSYYWIQRCRVPSQITIATSIFVLTITFAIATLGHTMILVLNKPIWLTPLLQVVVFTAPGGLIGGQLGSILAERMPLLLLERTIGAIFSLLGLWVLSHVLR